MASLTFKQLHDKFAKWRARQTFASDDLAHRAKLVEYDLALHATLPRPVPGLVALLRSNIRGFRAAMRATTP